MITILTRTEQIHLKPSPIISTACHYAKNFYNEANIIRKAIPDAFANGIEGIKLYPVSVKTLANEQHSIKYNGV